MANKKNPFIQKKGAFINSDSFAIGSKVLEQEREQRINGEEENLDLSSKVEKAQKEVVSEHGGEEKEEKTVEQAVERSQAKPKTKKSDERQRRRFENTIDQYVPKKYLKDDGLPPGTALVNPTILQHLKMYSFPAKMTVSDLVGVAIYKLLLEKGYVKDELLKEF
jgi:hypothetical protein